MEQEFRECDVSLKHELGSIRISCLSHDGAVVASWSLIQEVAGLNPFTKMTNILSLNSEKNI